jgi:DNA replication protein DnaC
VQALSLADAGICPEVAAAARLSALGRHEEARQRLEEAGGRQAEKDALMKAAGAAEADFEPGYFCPVCGDTGRVNGVVCGCVRAEMLRLRREEINRSGQLALCRFENFSLEMYPETLEENGAAVHPRDGMRAILADCRDWAGEFGPHSPSLYMFGNAGLGKTHLALSIASQVLDAGHDVIYVSAQNVFAAIAGAWGAQEDLFGSMLDADLLVLDDLGTEFLNAYVAGKLYELVNGRMGRRPTIYTTNICSKKMLDARYDEKVTSRLLGECHLMRFWGEDIRLKKRRSPDL